MLSDGEGVSVEDRDRVVDAAGVRDPDHEIEGVRDPDHEIEGVPDGVRDPDHEIEGVGETEKDADKELDAVADMEPDGDGETIFTSCITYRVGPDVCGLSRITVEGDAGFTYLSTADQFPASSTFENPKHCRIAKR